MGGEGGLEKVSGEPCSGATGTRHAEASFKATSIHTPSQYASEGVWGVNLGFRVFMDELIGPP